MPQFQQKDLIIALRDEGLSYREIAEKAHTSIEYARTVYSRSVRRANQKATKQSGTCRFCGEPLVFTEGAKKKQFCNDHCRNGFYNRKNLRKPYVRICKFCGQEFISYGYPRKQFCSQDCRTASARKKKQAQYISDE